MITATMSYDIQTSGVRVSFLIMDEDPAIAETDGSNFDDIDKTEPGVWGFPQTPANLRRLANMLNAMADFKERTSETYYTTSRELIHNEIKEMEDEENDNERGP